jgi:hypothetical protein
MGYVLGGSMKHRYIVALVAVSVAYGSLKLIAGIVQHVEPDTHVPTWDMPLIPECDAPLWDRIKDKCNEQTD